MKKKFKMAAAGSRLHKGLTKFTKAERKMMKKQTKALHMLKKKSSEVGQISDVPTPFLLVKNGGLMCGVHRQDLLDLFKNYGKLEDLIMLPGKSYSYALFSSTKSAEEAMRNISGQTLNQTVLAGRTFYMAYLLKRPCVELQLFDKSYPPGMILIEDFISESLELELLQYFSSSKGAVSLNEINVPAEQQLKHRYVKHYGYEFMYGSNNVDKDNPLPNGIPNECLPVVEKLVSLDCLKQEPDQLTINEYQPGQGIPPHVDTHSAFEDGIISLSLGAKVAMEFRHPDGGHISVLLPRRSVLIMTEECRYVWTHGITPRKYDVVNEEDTVTKENNSTAGDAHSTTQHFSKSSNAMTLLPREVRLSLTFRKVRRTPCDCKYPAHCDSRNYLSCLQSDDNKEGSNSDDHARKKRNTLPQSEEDAVNLEKEHVHNVYETIAEHFSGTRHSPWPKIAAFLKEQPPGSIIADVGCGNGKYLGINDQLLMFGSDRSQNLAGICRERGYHVIVCDILSLPYRSNCFDVCICIAVIHHLSTVARRLAAIKELTRIIRPGGRILISVWALEQNLKDTDNRKTRDHSARCAQKGSNMFSTPNQEETQDLNKTDASFEGWEGYCCDSRTIQTTSSAAVESVIEDEVVNVQESCSKVTEGTRELGYQHNIRPRADLPSHHIENTRTLNTTKFSSIADNATGAPKPDDALEVFFASSSTSRHQKCSNIVLETATQEVKRKVESQDMSSLPECIAAASRGNSLELKVNASRNAFEQQDLLIPWHYRGQKDSNNSCKKSSCVSKVANVDQNEVELNSKVEEKVPKVFQRFYHVFKENELADECKKLKNVSIVRSYYDKGNWCVELEKVREN